MALFFEDFILRNGLANLIFLGFLWYFRKLFMRSIIHLIYKNNEKFSRAFFYFKEKSQMSKMCFAHLNIIKSHLTRVEIEEKVFKKMKTF